MKINDYDFHKKFQHLIKWCKPGIKYCLNSNGLTEFNKFRKSLGYREIDLTDTSERHWFCIKDGEFVTKYETHKIDNITDLNAFTFTFTFTFAFAFALAEIILDTNNLAEL